jgi:hypothetical protein
MSENGLVSYTWKITRTTMPSPIQLKNPISNGQEKGSFRLPVTREVLVKKNIEYRSISVASKQRIIRLARERGSFADAHPEKLSLRCLNPGCSDLTLNDIPPGSNLYFQWQCDNNENHMWSTSVKNRGRYNCPHCNNESKPDKIRNGKTLISRMLKNTNPHLFKLLIKVKDSCGREIPKDGICVKSNAMGYWKTEACDHPSFWSRIADRVRKLWSREGGPAEKPIPFFVYHQQRSHFPGVL